ncbi:MAG: hypothetical protein E6G21_07600 [Actinobacteria bacterium]|nr:MAG: hypothetical protein E6G21_07600 [Actinomycetota bacterium]
MGDFLRRRRAGPPRLRGLARRDRGGPRRDARPGARTPPRGSRRHVRHPRPAREAGRRQDDRRLRRRQQRSAPTRPLRGALGRGLPLPRRGDLIAVELAGAYGRVMSSTYNARPLCAEVVLEQGSWRVSRERGTYDDLVRNERT